MEHENEEKTLQMWPQLNKKEQSYDCLQWQGPRTQNRSLQFKFQQKFGDKIPVPSKLAQFLKHFIWQLGNIV